MSRIALAALTGGLMVAAAPASAAPIISENFNTGFGVFTVEGPTIDRNTARPGYQVCCGATGSDAALDNPFVVFGAGNVTNRGSIFTEFQTALGVLYTLSFRAGAFGEGTTNLSYSFGGVSNTLTLAANNNVDTTFSTYTAQFVGTGNPTALSFSSRGAGTNIDPVLDDVSVQAAVPEPATWGMMMLGFGGLGYSMRRRTKAAARIRFA